ncbi:MAG TPA: sigma factor-like helix-turn-helix DNA-binding protein [Micromonosporaceae bacterium]|nr:sigma factor-like helix-turn-helix DNA-binding protein [Micromonosporaceae bacterium]
MATTPDHAAANPPSIEDRVVVRAALDRLPRRQRAVLVLRFLTDMSVLDVADVLDCSPATVKSQTFHGLATLRRVLGEPAYVTLIERT